MRTWGKFLPLAIATATLTVGCGGSGGNGGSGKGESVTMRGFTITEDRSLDDSLNGIWVEDGQAKYTAQFGDDYGGAFNSGKESLQQTIAIIEEDGELYIRDCFDAARNIENGSKTLEFDLGFSHYVLDKHSNTRMTGTIDFAQDNEYVQSEGSGTVTLFKASEAPATQAQLLSDFNIGLLRYSLNGRAEQLIGIQCFRNHNGTYTSKTDGETAGPFNYNGFLLGTFSDEIDIIEFYEDEEDGEPDLYVTLDDAYANMEADEAGEYINITANGTNAITIEIDASTNRDYYDSSSDSSSDSFNATAELNL